MRNTVIKSHKKYHMGNFTLKVINLHSSPPIITIKTNCASFLRKQMILHSYFCCFLTRKHADADTCTNMFYLSPRRKQRVFGVSQH